jgi:hypothetical protein
VETADLPLRWVLDSPCPDHVQVDIYEASDQVLVSSHGSREIAVFPECSSSGFPLVVFLCSPSRNQLHALGDRRVCGIPNQQMNVIAGGDVVQNAQSVSLGRLKQPEFPAQAVAFKLQQKLSAMTAMGDMPYATGNIESIGSGHEQRIQS